MAKKKKDNFVRWLDKGKNDITPNMIFIRL